MTVTPYLQFIISERAETECFLAIPVLIMMPSDDFDNVYTTAEAEFDYEPIDFRLPTTSSSSPKSHAHLNASPHQPHEHHYEQHLNDGLHEMQTQGCYPSPIVRRGDPAEKSTHGILYSEELISCGHDGCPRRDIPESLPSPPKLLSKHSFTAPEPSDTAWRYMYHYAHQDTRSLPPYKPSDRWSADASPFQQHTHPSPSLSQMNIGVSSGSTPSRPAMASSFCDTSGTSHATWNVQPLAVPRSAQTSFHETSGQPTSSLSPPSHKEFDAVHCHPTDMRSFEDRATHATPLPLSRGSLPDPKIVFVDKYHDTDVLCGRGGATNSHKGNRKFRSIVASHRESYLAAKKRDKPTYAQYVLDLVRNHSRKRRCRFLKKDEKSDRWYDIGNEKAREKVAQA
jgi:hypothetical protein